MKRIIGLALCGLSTVALAETPVTLPDTVETAPAAIDEEKPQRAVLRAGIPVSLTMLEEITTKKKSAKVGQRFQLEVSAPIEVNGVTVIPPGTPAWGEITTVRNKGMWGKSGKLDARLLYLRANGRQIRLTGSFDDKGVTGTAGVVGSVALIPVAGFFMTGTSAVLPKGGIVSGFIDEDVELAFSAKPAPMQVPVSPVVIVPTPTAEPEKGESLVPTQESATPYPPAPASPTPR
ncbi:MAG: hypothetical protein WCY92_13600 [Novosphingobium sp.]